MVFQWHLYNCSPYMHQSVSLQLPKYNYCGFILGLYECLREHSSIKLFPSSELQPNGLEKIPDLEYYLLRMPSLENVPMMVTFMRYAGRIIKMMLTGLHNC